MLCDDVARLLPEAVENGAAVELRVQRHIDHCLRCQAEVARYRKMLRGLQLLRTRYLEPAPGAARADPRRHRGGGGARGAPRDPLRSAARLRRCDRRGGGRRRRRHRGDDRAPLAAARGSRHELSQRDADGVERRLRACRRGARSRRPPAACRAGPVATSSAPSIVDTTNVARSSAWARSMPCAREVVGHHVGEVAERPVARLADLADPPSPRSRCCRSGSPRRSRCRAGARRSTAP